MSIIKNIRNAMGLENYDDDDMYDDEDDMDDDYEDEKKSLTSIFASKRETREPRSSYAPMSRQEEGKIVNLHNNRTTINILKPKTFEDAPKIADALKNGQIILVNTSIIEKKNAQRLLDFISGACYALGGDVREVDSGVYVFSPPSIDVEDSGARNGSEKGFIDWEALR